MVRGRGVVAGSEAQPPGLDPDAWVEAHGDALFRFALLHVKDRDAAEDLVQECLLAAWHGRERYAGRSAERTWLIGILRHKIVDHYRSRCDAPAGAGEDASRVSDFFTPRGVWRRGPRRWPGDPAALARDGEFWGVFRQCLRSLPDPLAEAFVLCELDRVGGEQACQVLGITPTNLWQRLHRARLALRRCLESNWFKPPPEEVSASR